MKKTRVASFPYDQWEGFAAGANAGSEIFGGGLLSLNRAFLPF